MKIAVLIVLAVAIGALLLLWARNNVQKKGKSTGKSAGKIKDMAVSDSGKRLFGRQNL